MIYKPELPYPEGYCHECGEHIKENDLFGLMRGQRIQERTLVCDFCYNYFKPSSILNICVRYKKEDLLADSSTG